MTDSSCSLLIDPLRLPALLGNARGRFDVDSLAECESTSTLLLKRASLGAPSGSVIVTDRQSAGRGSRGRQWLASPQASLTFSVLWRFDGGLERLAGLSLAVGLSLVQALEACGAAGISLKWPNDILHGNAKLGGILVELQSAAQNTTQNEPDRAVAVIGIGINLSLPASAEERQGFSLPAAALDSALCPLPDRHFLLARLLGELAQVLDRFAAGGFAVLREEWQARHSWQDRPVRLLRDGRVEKEGICRGADIDGALLVQTASGIERCLSGDLSLRIA
jgi:BirA family biotin operon repressor/biotin-[acetyl-CoA-carboxylase] ligase